MSKSISGGVEIINTLSTKNDGDYPLVMAESVGMKDGANAEDVIKNKLNTNQGTENNGKFMKVGADGNLKPEIVPIPDVSAQINTHDKSPTSHNDIRDSVNTLKNDKLDKNQGVNNTGKIITVGDDGNVVTRFPNNVTYNPDTKNLEYGSNDSLPLIDGVKLDTSLTKGRFAADAKITGDKINKIESEATTLKEDLGKLTETIFPQKESTANKWNFYIINHTFDIDSKIIVSTSGTNYGLNYTKNGNFVKVADYGLYEDTIINVSKGDRVDVIQIITFDVCSVNCKVIGDKFDREFIENGLVVHNYGTLVKQYYQNMQYNPVYWESGVCGEGSNNFITNPLPIIKGKNIYIDSTYTAHAVFYDENGEYLGYKELYYGKPILNQDIYENAYYIAFSVQTISPIIDSTQLNTSIFDNRYIRRSVSTRNYMEGTRPKTYIYKNDTIDTIVAKMNEALATENVDVYWEYGTYNLNGLYNVLKTSYAFAGTTPRGIFIGGNCKYYFNNSTLIKDNSDVPTEDNYPSDILEGVYCTHAKNCDYEIYDLNIHGIGITYCIHDDVGTDTLDKNYRKYSNCTMKYTANERSTYLSKCIGGGTGKMCYREIENCNFYMDGSSPNIREMQEVSFHGASEAYNNEAYLELKVRDCYFQNGIGQHSLAPKQTADFYMSGCSLGKYSKPSETSRWKSYVWNNEIRTV